MIGPLAPDRRKPWDPEVHFRGRRSQAWGSAFAPLLPVPAQRGGRKKEPRAASLHWRMRPLEPCPPSTSLGQPPRELPGTAARSLREGSGATRSRHLMLFPLVPQDNNQSPGADPGRPHLTVGGRWSQVPRTTSGPRDSLPLQFSHGEAPEASGPHPSSLTTLPSVPSSRSPRCGGPGGDTPGSPERRGSGAEGQGPDAQVPALGPHKPPGVDTTGTRRRSPTHSNAGSLPWSP